MLVPEAIGKVSLEEGDFYRRDHALIYRAICELDRKAQPFDAVTLGEWFEAQGLAEQVGGSYLVDLACNTPSAANIGAYAAIVKDKAVRRRLITAATEAANAAYEGGEETATLVDSTIGALMALSKQD